MKAQRFIAALAIGVMASAVLAAPAVSAPAKTKDPVGKMDAAVRRAAGLEAEAKPVRGKGVGRAAALDKDQSGRVVVYVHGKDKGRLAAAVKHAGGAVTDTSGSRVRAVVPPASLDDLAKVAAVTEIRQPDEAVPMGSTTEGLQPSGALPWHLSGRKGAGVKVGIIDVGFGRLDDAVDSGDLPAGLPVFDGQCGPDHQRSHGTEMAEIVHDMAPDAQLYLACVTDVMGFDDAANWLKQQGVTVVNLSLGFPGTGRGSGVPASNNADDPQRVVQDLRGSGILVVAAAGNEAEKHWSAQTADGNNDGWVTIEGTSEVQGFSVPNGAEITVELKWDAWPATNDDLDLYVSSALAKPAGINDDSVRGRVSYRPQKDTPGGLDPVEKVSFRQDAGAATYWIYVKSNGARQGLRYDLTIHGSAAGVQHIKSAGSIAEPATSPYVLAVGAITPESAAQDGSVESYSSRGPTIDGRTKPDLTGFTKVTTTVNNQSTGTSAAAAHVAGAAALYKGANPALDPGQLEALLLDSASRPRRDNDFGYGVLHTGAPRAPQAPTGSGFTALPTRRVFDSHSAPHNGPLAAGEQVTLSIPGLPDDTTAVVLNVTGMEATATTQLDIAADRPNRTPTLTVRPGRIASVMTFATYDPVHKQLKIRNTTASAHVIIDLVGYFNPSSGASSYFPFKRPLRLDTPATRLTPGQPWTLPVRGVAAIPQTATSALVSITAEAADAAMHVEAYATNAPGAWAFSLYPTERTTYTYLVPIGDDGSIRIQAGDAGAAVSVDVLGYFGSGAGAKYVPMRDADTLFDTATGTGTWVDPMHADQTRPVPVLGNFRVPFQMRAAVLSVTAPTSDRRTDLQVSPGDGSWSANAGLSSDVVGKPNALRPPSSNTAVVPIIGSHVVNVRNQHGNADVVAGLSGYFVGGSPVDAPAPGTTSGHWKFDEGVGSTAADSSPGSKTATLSGGAAWTDGRSGKALSLNGTTAAAVAEPSGVAIENGFTVSAWARLDRKDGVANVVAQDGNRVSGYYLDYRPDSNRWNFVVPSADTDDPALYAVAATEPVRTGQWTHLTGVYDAAKRELRIYVDGSLAGVSPDITVVSSRGATTIGRAKWNGSPVDFFPGAIDDARVYDRALTAGQIREVFQSYGAQAAAHPAGASLNGDARDELFGNHDGGGTVRTWPNTGTFPSPPFDWSAEVAWGYPEGNRVKVADLDGDGRSEFIEVNNAGDGKIYAWHNTGGFPAGNWGAKVEIGSGWHGNDGSNVHFADLTGDGRDELIIVNANGDQKIRAWINTGAYPSAPFLVQNVVIGDGWSNPAPLKFGDLDGDGKAELVAVNLNGKILSWHNNGKFPAFPWDAPVEVGTSGAVDAARYRLADLDGDGRSELIGVNVGNDGRISAHRNWARPSGVAWDPSPHTVGLGWNDHRRAVFG